MLANQRITGRTARKDVRHVELSLGGSGLVYEPGDALGVWPENPPVLVEEIARVLNAPLDLAITREGKTQPLHAWLSSGLEVTRLSRRFVEAHAAREREHIVQSWFLPSHAARLTDVLSSWNVLDLLQLHPAAWSAQEWVR